MTRYFVVTRCLAPSALAASALLFCAAQTLAAPRASHALHGSEPRPAPAQKELTAPAQKEILQAPYDLNAGQHAVYDFTADAPGKLSITLQSQGMPVMLTLVKPGGERLALASAAPIEYTVTAEDLGRGTQWKLDVYLAAKNSPQAAAGIVPKAHASGSIAIQASPAGTARNVRTAPIGSAAARAAATDLPPPVAHPALAQTVASKRKDEFAPAPSGNSTATPPPAANSNTGSTSEYPAYQPGSDANPPPPSTPDTPSTPPAPNPQGSSPQLYQDPNQQGQYQQPYQQGQYQDPYQQGQYKQGQYQQPEAPVQSALQQQSPQYQQPAYQGQPAYQPGYQGQPAYQGQQPAYQGQQPSYQGQQPQYQAQPNMPAGFCTVKLSTDRSTIHMVDSATGTERKHLSLGQDRVQKVFSSPDNAWSVAVYKVRGVQQYGFIALELAKCEDQLPVELAAVPSEARFDQAEVVLVIDSKEKHFPLKNSRMQ